MSINSSRAPGGMRTAGTGCLAGGAKNARKTGRNFRGRTRSARALARRSAGHAKPIVPVSNQWLLRSSPSLAKRFGTDVNE